MCSSSFSLPAGRPVSDKLKPSKQPTPEMPNEKPNPNSLLELAELLDRLAGAGKNAKDVEPDLEE